MKQFHSMTPTSNVADTVARSMFVITWTHIHSCVFSQFYTKFKHPYYVPMYIPKRLPTSIASSMTIIRETPIASLVFIEGIVDTRALTDSAPTDVHCVLPVHSTSRREINSEESVVFIASKRFYRGDVIAHFDPHYPVPNWLPKAVDGLKSIRYADHESGIIRPIRKKLRESSNSFLTSGSIGPYLPCYGVDDVANVVLKIHDLLNWECKANSDSAPIFLPHITVVAKSNIFVGQKILLDHYALKSDQHHVPPSSQPKTSLRVYSDGREVPKVSPFLIPITTFHFSYSNRSKFQVDLCRTTQLRHLTTPTSQTPTTQTMRRRRQRRRRRR